VTITCPESGYTVTLSTKDKNRVNFLSGFIAHFDDLDTKYPFLPPPPPPPLPSPPFPSSPLLPSLSLGSMNWMVSAVRRPITSSQAMKPTRSSSSTLTHSNSLTSTTFPYSSDHFFPYYLYIFIYHFLIVDGFFF